MKAFMVAGDRSGSGKTSITLAIAGTLARSRTVAAFKVGMDYIDPSYHAAATGRPCRNLDSFVMSEDEIRDTFARGSTGAEIAVVEGVRGLFEGADGRGDAGSSASIAKILGIPVVLVIDARSITRSAAAIIRGFAGFDPEVQVAGVILNNVSGPQHRRKLCDAVSHYTGLPVAGTVPRVRDAGLEMRHLGLVPFQEGMTSHAFRSHVEGVVKAIGEAIDYDVLLACARDVEAAPASPPDYPSADIRIGVASDEVFTFYYHDLFEVLPSLGVEVVRWSPVSGRLPDCDGYILGGGYPELYCRQLEANTLAREALREHSRNGIPVYAECGGLMYVTDRMRLSGKFTPDGAEESFEMAGLIPGETVMPWHRVVSYVEGSSPGGSCFGPCHFRGHEFHYSKVSLDDRVGYAFRLSRGQGIDGGRDGATVRRTTGSYTHLHPLSSRAMFQAFVGACRERV
jgi:cobyrinic acid a,c-diamide synthase